MTIQKFTKIAGILFVAIGVLGFVPGLTLFHPAGDLSADPAHSHHGMLFGLFPINVLHNLIHIGFGIWALSAAKDAGKSRTFCRANAVIYAMLAVMGLVPGLNTLFGLVPLYGNDVWLHGLIALSTGYFGFVYHKGPTFSKPALR